MRRFEIFRRNLMKGLAAVIGFAALGGVAMAADFPTKPVTMIIPYGAGGGTTAMGRVYAKALGEELGQPVVVVNRKGGGGAIGASFLKNEPADGYTVLMGGIDEIVAWIANTKEVDFNKDDFRYLGAVANYQNAFMAPSGQPFSNLKEFVAHAKANPGTPVVTLGGMDRLFYEMIIEREKLDLRLVTANGGAEVVKLLLAGNAAVGYSGGIHSKYEGKIKVVASLNPIRLTGAPNAPTFVEEGYGMSMTSMIGLMAPAGVPDEIAGILEAAILRAGNNADFKKIVDARLKSDVNLVSARDTTSFILDLEAKLRKLAKKE